MESFNPEVISAEIVSLTGEWEPRLFSLPEEVISQRRNSQNRTIRQIVGHMVDSASNNIHRVVHLQYQPSPLVFPNYASEGNNDRWIAIQHYQEEDWSDLIRLWKHSMLHFSHVIKHVDREKLNREWIAGPGKMVTLESMITDFNRHLKLHLSEIVELINEVRPC
jgi:hypothetical protein